MNTSKANKKSGIEQRIRVGERLLTAAEYVAVSSVKNKDGKKVCADIGCDHGYLSIYLIEKGICDFVYASDINEKPVNTAKSNIKNRDTRGLDLSGKIDIRLADGLSGMEDKGINHIIICGMGGEVIAGILQRAKSFWRNDVSFILQPMSSEYELRVWLLENGFEILCEKLVRDSGRIYTVMNACYSGAGFEYSQAELMLGRHNIAKGGELLCELCERKLVHAKNLLLSVKASEKDVLLERELSLLLSDLKGKGADYGNN